VKLAGIILCGLAGLGFAAMSTVLVTSLWVTRLIGPALVLGLGVLLVVSALAKRSPEKPGEPAEEEQAVVIQ
jgi:ABC-type thiamin/hydroxymethylpyrimidine transport system permease subunit